MYDNPDRRKYIGSAPTDFGAGADVAYTFIGPKGKAGRLYDYGIEGVAEAFSALTITPKIAIGTLADPDAYGDEIDLNAIATTNMKSVRTLYSEPESGFATLMVNRELPADTKFVMTCTVGTASPTGQAVPFVIVDWQN